MLRAPILVAFALQVTATSAIAQPTSMSLGNGVVVVPHAGRVYVMDPSDGVVAVELATGRVLWKTRKRAAKPLVQLGERLVALDEKGRLRVLDVKTGKAASRCSTLPNISLPLLSSLGSDVSSEGLADRARGWITSTHSSYYAGGAAPTPELEAASRSHGEGLVEVDLAVCAVRNVDSHPYQPKSVGQSEVEYVTPGGTRFRLRPGELVRENATGPLPLVALPRKPETMPSVNVSADQRHVFASDGVYLPGRGYAVEIVEVDSGERVASAVLALYPNRAVLVDRRLVVGGGLAGVYDLDAGKQVWTRGIRTTGYHGPYPPSAAP